MQQSLSEEQVVRGTIGRVTFHNPENGYSVLQLDLSGGGERVTVVGHLQRASIGTHIVARGVFRQHARYGRQLTATSITEVTPSSSEGIRKYLASGAVKGVGSKTAARLVARFGDKTIETILKEPEMVAALSGIGKHKAELLRTALAGQAEVQEIMRFLLEHNISQGLASKIYERYGNQAIEILSSDPYLLARDLRGVGFATADQIAKNMGLKPDAPQRLKAGLYYALEKAADDGHCYQPKAYLLQKTSVLLGIADQHELSLEEHLESLAKEGFLVIEEDQVYLKHLYRAEEFVAQFVADRCEPREAPEIELKLIEKSLGRAQSQLGISFSAEQKQAVKDAALYRFMIITGGPGCGKTTLIRALSIMFRSAQKRLFLAAPTGRAAQRMAQVCDMSASTIHRLLRYDPATHHFLHGLNDPLPTDAVIIDEASMIDIQLARDLFSAIPRGATLILVGDKDQLPSVGPGRVFGDLVALKDLRTVSLTKLFRRAEESTITSIAHLINSGIVPDIPELDGVTKSDAYFLARSEPEEAARAVENLVAEQIPKKFGFEPSEIAVLTPSNRGEVGAERLNKRLQNRLNPAGSVDSEQELTVNGVEFRVRDRVCQRVNNYQIDELGVFNGDIGQVFGVDRKSASLLVELWDGRVIRYNSGDTHQLSLAYAVTVHRAQGSEMPCVVLVLHDSQYTLLERQLIYTAITRAKKLLIIVGSKRALLLAIKKTDTKRRCSFLKERIERAFK
jgi:exodeoxyribonuclease V alpha subunit